MYPWLQMILCPSAVITPEKAACPKPTEKELYPAAKIGSVSPEAQKIIPSLIWLRSPLEVSQVPSNFLAQAFAIQAEDGN